MAVTLSLAMIVRDEQETLGRVLEDAGAFCDELVVVDTGSTDASREIADKAGAKVIDFPWVDDFAAARNASFDACESDWIIWLDADDSVPADVQQRLRAAKADLLWHTIDAVYTPYRYRFNPDGSPQITLPRERLLRRAANFRWEGVVHEVIPVPQHRAIYREDLYIEHRTDPVKDARKGDRNLRILERAVQGGNRELRTLFYFGNELSDHGRNGEALAVHREFLDSGATGWERYHAVLRMAHAAKAEGRPQQAVNHLLSAVRTDPARAEAYVRLAEYYYEDKQWAQAIPLLNAAIACRRPEEGFLFESDYTWLPWDYLAVCLSQLGRHSEAVPAALRSLELGNPEKPRVQHNLRWSIDHI